MGVSGLTSFIDQFCSGSVLESLKLHDTLLLIDGYGFLYRMHKVHNIQSAYGGNYDELAKKLCNLFELFAKCKIEPIVVMDGGRDADDRKFQTALKRNSMRLKEVVNMNDIIKNKLKKNNAKNGLLINEAYRIAKQILPIMAYKVFLDVLNKYEVTHFQTCFEADYELACLANELKCPILSFDSDYFVYDLKYGYISIGYLMLDTRKAADLSVCDDEGDDDGEEPTEAEEGETETEGNEEEGNEDAQVDQTEDEDLDLDDVAMVEDDQNSTKTFYIPARIYKLEKFLKYFSSADGKRQMTREKMAILAVLLGNDYVERSLFQPLLSTFDSTNNNLKFKRFRGNASGYAKKKKEHFNRLLNWLAAFKSTEDAVNHILNYIPIEKRGEVQTVIESSIKDYLCQKPSNRQFYKSYIESRINSKLANLSLNEGGAQAGRHFQETNLKTKTGRIINDEFLMKYFECRMPRFALDIIVHHRILFPCQIEVSQWPSSYFSSRPLRECFYRQLLNACKNVSASESENKDEGVVEIQEYLRHQNSTKIFEMSLDLAKDSSQEVTGSYVLKELFRFDDSLIRSVLQSDVRKEENTIQRIRMLFALIFYWITWSLKDDLPNKAEYAELNQLKTLNCMRMFIVSFIKCSIVNPCFARMNKKQKASSTASNTPVVLDSSKSKLKQYKTESNPLTGHAVKRIAKSGDISELVDEIVADHEANFEYIQQLYVRLNSYCQFPESNLATMSNIQKLFKIFNVRLIHCLSEFQAIYHSASFLSVLELPDLGSFFNGSFLHNFYQDLSSRSYPDLFIEELFGRKSFFTSLYLELNQMFLSMFSTHLEKYELLKSSNASAPQETSSAPTMSRRQKKNAKVKRLLQE